MTIPSPRSLLVRSLLGLALVATLVPAMARPSLTDVQVCSWTGGGSHTDSSYPWTDAANWDAGCAGTPGTGADVTIGTSTATRITDVPTISLDQLTITNDGSTALTLQPASSSETITITHLFNWRSGTIGAGLTIELAGGSGGYMIGEKDTGDRAVLEGALSVLSNAKFWVVLSGYQQPIGQSDAVFRVGPHSGANGTVTVHDGGRFYVYDGAVAASDDANDPGWFGHRRGPGRRRLVPVGRRARDGPHDLLLVVELTRLGGAPRPAGRRAHLRRQFGARSDRDRRGRQCRGPIRRHHRCHDDRRDAPAQRRAAARRPRHGTDGDAARRDDHPHHVVSRPRGLVVRSEAHRSPYGDRRAVDDVLLLRRRHRTARPGRRSHGRFGQHRRPVGRSPRDPPRSHPHPRGDDDALAPHGRPRHVHQWRRDLPQRRLGGARGPRPHGSARRHHVPERRYGRSRHQPARAGCRDHVRDGVDREAHDHPYGPDRRLGLRRDGAESQRRRVRPSRSTGRSPRPRPTPRPSGSGSA